LIPVFANLQIVELGLLRLQEHAHELVTELEVEQRLAVVASNSPSAMLIYQLDERFEAMQIALRADGSQPVRQLDVEEMLSSLASAHHMQAVASLASPAPLAAANSSAAFQPPVRVTPVGSVPQAPGDSTPYVNASSATMNSVGTSLAVAAGIPVANSIRSSTNETTPSSVAIAASLSSAMQPVLPQAAPTQANAEAASIAPHVEGLITEAAPSDPAALSAALTQFLNGLESQAHQVGQAPFERDWVPWVVAVSLSAAALELSRRQLKRQALVVPLLGHRPSSRLRDSHARS
jgi:hypothetical protein